MRLIVTDLTQMGPKYFCLAGWDVDNKQMVRPLPSGDNWPRTFVEKLNIQVGSIIRLEITGKHSASYPHLTEDVEVSSKNIVLEDALFENWFDDAGPEGFSDLDSAFSGNVKYNKKFRGCKQGTYVPINTKCKSLIGLNIPVASIEFFSCPFDRKLKAYVTDENSKYEMSVTSHRLKNLYGQGGLEAINSFLANASYAHVRVGLARAWESHPEKCFIMLNEVHCLL